MTQRWERIFTCGRCRAEARMEHHCARPGVSDWAKGWIRLESMSQKGQVFIDICPDCNASYMRWLETVDKEPDLEPPE